MSCVETARDVKKSLNKVMDFLCVYVFLCLLSLRRGCLYEVYLEPGVEIYIDTALL